MACRTGPTCPTSWPTHKLKVVHRRHGADTGGADWRALRLDRSAFDAIEASSQGLRDAFILLILAGASARGARGSSHNDFAARF
jgi:hypothetical protein